MKYLLYIVAGLLLIIWGVLKYSFEADNAVHVLLVVASFPILLNIFSREESI